MWRGLDFLEICWKLTLNIIPYIFNFGCNRMVISRRNLDKLKELRGFVEVKDKDALLKELSEKREEIRY